MDALNHIWIMGKREFKYYFESPVAYVFIVVFLMLAGFMGFQLGFIYERGQADLTYFFRWHPWLYLILVPAVSMRLWSEERNSRTIETLLTFPITLAQAIMAKFLAAWAFLGLALLLTWPAVYTVSNMLEGNVDKGAVIGSYLGSFLLAGAYLSIGMLTSAFTRNQVISFVTSVKFCLIIALIGWPPITDFFKNRFPVDVVDTIAAISVMPSYHKLQSGMIDIQDLLYFASVMIFLLCATHVVLDWRKGR